MREIKFRAWHKTLLIMIPFEEIYAEFQTVRPVMLKEIIEYEKYELLQYTGLHDKNGKEIYEGDIVKYRGWISWGEMKVVFSDGSFMVENHNLNANLINEFDIKIIGNIYSNPELLEENNNA